VAGGGGKGMRLCRDEAELRKVFGTAQAEAKAAFGNGDCYIEKVILNPHHVEIQLMGDKFGHIIHLGERDCTVQRRHQKLIEETPSPVVDAELRTIMGNTAVRGASVINYLGAGTMEFLVDRDGNFYFMEMNTRIQVEHPITEEATEIDIVQEQIRVAAGEKLRYHQEDVIMKWHSMECRINAEDPENGFRPAPGHISSLYVPGGPGVRVETAVYGDYSIPPFYDSMIAKLIVKDRDRNRVIRKMLGALEEFVVEGIPTTVEFQKTILQHPDFVSNNFDTSFVDKRMGEKKQGPAVKIEEKK
jgi:acetyl-CoA carboxylase biotin carboxylase subunit